MREFVKLGQNLKKNCDERVIRRLKDMADRYYDQSLVKKILKKRNPLIYKVYVKKFGTMSLGLTVMEPGVIGKEYYMTKGHTHNKPSSEIYILLKGSGSVILQNKKSGAVKLKKGLAFTVPPKNAHRLVNTGKGKLEVLALYLTEAGHNYKTKFKERLFNK